MCPEHDCVINIERPVNFPSVRLYWELSIAK